MDEFINSTLTLIGKLTVFHPFPKQQILDSSNLKEFADDNFKFDGNGRKFSKTGRKNCVKRRNCLSRAISPFSTVFSKDLYCRHGLVWEGVNPFLNKPLFLHVCSTSLLKTVREKEKLQFLLFPQCFQPFSTSFIKFKSLVCKIL